jgi:hypothetical protein
MGMGAGRGLHASVRTHLLCRREGSEDGRLADRGPMVAAGGGHKKGRRAMSFAMLGAGCSALDPVGGAKSRGQGKEGGLLVPGAHPNLPGRINRKRGQGRGRGVKVEVGEMT